MNEMIELWKGFNVTVWQGIVILVATCIILCVFALLKMRRMSK